jgi:hypothetical protein
MVLEMIPENFIKLNDKFHYVLSKIKTEKIPKQSIVNIKEYYDYLWETTAGISDNFLKDFPISIKNDILYEKYKEAFKNSNLFYNVAGELEQPLVKSLISLLEIRVYQKNDFITRLGAYDKNTYFVLDGVLYMYGANDEYIGYLR